ncbi:hypothetical protein GUJ93_ZPchr0006g42754 [Zizania palustris]|uniref:Uncharacterized protein n=1 Tax=Zizania palustris TaxID=103762 RepID=A0A8J5T543_ZIZPA|nr:hypothetical protein GUJ93_ZPchr0006g42754 [Zizania palustris]
MSKLLAVLALLLCATTVTTVAEAYNPVTLRGIWRALSLSREEDATPRAASSPSIPPAVPSPAPSSPRLPVPPAASPEPSESDRAASRVGTSGTCSSAPVTAEFCAGHTAVRPGLSVASAGEHDYYLRCSQPSCSRRSRGDQRSARSCSILGLLCYPQFPFSFF